MEEVYNSTVVAKSSDFDVASAERQNEMLKRGEYFLWLYPRTEYYFRKYASDELNIRDKDLTALAKGKSTAEPEKPVFIGDKTGFQTEARELYRAQFAEANELLKSSSILELTQSIHTTDINIVLPLTTTLKRWALASAKILLTKPFEHGWSSEVERETYGWEIGERRTPMAFGLSLPYSICKDLPKVFESEDMREALKEALARNSEYLASLKSSLRGFTAKQEQRLLLAKQQLGEGVRRVLCF